MLPISASARARDVPRIATRLHRVGLGAVHKYHCQFRQIRGTAASFQQSIAASESPSTAAGFAGLAGPAVSSPRLASNLVLDEATQRYLEDQQQLEIAAASVAPVAVIVTSLPVVNLMTALPIGESVEIDARIASSPIRTDIVHRVIVWQEKNNRTTLYKAKKRSEVSGGGRKPWKQKGTGKARAGSNRSPLWVGGGVAHPPKLRDWSTGLQKKVRRLGMRIALAAKLRDGRLVIIPSLDMPQGRTREAVAMLTAHGVNGRRTLWVGEQPIPDTFRQAIANIERTNVLPAIGANVTDIIKADTLFVTREALASITDRVTRGM